MSGVTSGWGEWSNQAYGVKEVDKQSICMYNLKISVFCWYNSSETFLYISLATQEKLEQIISIWLINTYRIIHLQLDFLFTIC